MRPLSSHGGSREQFPSARRGLARPAPEAAPIRSLVKVFLADQWLVSTSELVVDGWCSPWTAPAIQACTRDFLRGRSVLAESIDEATVILVDVVDHLAPLAERALADFAHEAAATGAKLAVRLHGAWRHRPADFVEHEAPDLRPVWDCADAVLVGSRSHLVRLASTGGIDAERTHLAPVAIGGPVASPEGAPRLEREQRTKLLVAGETHRAAVAPVLGMLEGDDPRNRTFQVIHGPGPFQEGLREARVLLVPSTGEFGDRALVDAAMREGVAVVASNGAAVLDAPLPPGLVVVSECGSAEAWHDALTAALATSPRAQDGELESILESQGEVLARISAASTPGGSHFKRQAAA